MMVDEEILEYSIENAASSVIHAHEGKLYPIPDRRFRHDTMTGQMQEIYLESKSKMFISLKKKDLIALWKKCCLKEHEKNTLIRKYHDFLRQKMNLDRKIKEIEKLMRKKFNEHK